MTFEPDYKEAFVWIWLPDAIEPVVAGRLVRDGNTFVFNYGRSYLERIDDSAPAIALYEPELPLRQGLLPLLPGLTMPGCLRDAAPDAWGRRVIINKRVGAKAKGLDVAAIDELTYLLDSGSDRVGALDFQLSPTEYIPRSARDVPLSELLESAGRVENGIPLSPELDQAIMHGSSIGGARPKALIHDGERKYIAKFSARDDLHSVVKAEFIAMRLAARVGLSVAPVSLVKAAGKDVLLVERFDREKTERGWSRRSMVSALTLFGLDDLLARYASYEQLTTIIRHRFTEPKSTLHELFSRLVFNILCGNNDDHARNHAAFWNGKSLTLTPAYDICPQGRTGGETGQAMRIIGDRNRSQLSLCTEAAHLFLLSKSSASEIYRKQIALIESCWDDVCAEAHLNDVDKKLLWRRQFLNPYAFEGTGVAPAES